MYIPAAFAESNVAKLQDAMERYSFAILTSGAADGLTASHLPLLVDRTSGPHGTLLGHMARASEHWKVAAGRPVLAVFSGPHAYISPRWYQAPQTVPTWNYVAIHAYGRLELLEDEDAALELLQRTVRFYESSQDQPWQLNESPEFVEKLVRQIVAFRIPIERLEGKWKLNQNRPADQRARVIEKLSGQTTDDARAIAELMRGVA